jgi:hypothetical protein
MNLSKVVFASIHTPVSDPNSLIIQTAGICGDPTVQNSVAAPHHQEHGARTLFRDVPADKKQTTTFTM